MLRLSDMCSLTAIVIVHCLAVEGEKNATISGRWTEAGAIVTEFVCG